jgi:hypothetical protein
LPLGGWQRKPQQIMGRREGTLRAPIARDFARDNVSAIASIARRTCRLDFNRKSRDLWQYNPEAIDLGATMRSYIETGAIIAACGSAIFWFVSAMSHLPSAKPGTDELEKIAELSKKLQRMSRWNFWAAGLMGITALLSAWLRFLG